LFSENIAVQNFGVSKFFFKESNSFIQQRHIKLIKSDINFRKKLAIKCMLFFWTFF